MTCWLIHGITIFIAIFSHQTNRVAAFALHNHQLNGAKSVTIGLHSTSPSTNFEVEDTTSAVTKTRNISSIHLISLPALSDQSPKIIKDVWKWKDIVLGDGRDYFIPRPRALKALSDILIGRPLYSSEKGYSFNNKNDCQSMQHVVKECAILSNCARMDILLCLETNATMVDEQGMMSVLEMQELAQEASNLIVSNCLVGQLTSYQTMRNTKGGSAIIWEGISSFLDLPGMVISGDDSANNIDDASSITGVHSTFEINEATKNLASLMRRESKLDEIILHFCLVAAGLAQRDSRPGRPVTFRPFSSRDAHIMLQLKRTVEVAGQYPRMKIILDSALNGGKAARDVNKVPILKELKKYDFEGKYSTPAPPQLASDAVDAVRSLAIQPAIDRCLNNLTSQQNAERIALFKNQVDSILKSKGVGENQSIKKIVHDTIMELRSCNGDNNVDFEAVYSKIEATFVQKENTL